MIRVMPGSTIATRTPNAATSIASSSLIPSNAHFAATYGAWAIAPMRPVTDVTFTIVPEPRARMPGSTCWMQRTPPHRSTFITSRKRSGVVSSTTPLPPMPALFTRWSIRPARSMISSKPSRTESSSAMSSSTSSTVTPDCSAAAFSLSARAIERTVPNTTCPAAARCRAVARPMPELAPVTTVTAW